MKDKLLIALSILLCSSCAHLKQKRDSRESLKESYEQAFIIGTAVSEEIILKDTLSKNIVLKHFNTITPENVMKAEVINPEPGVYNFKPADDFVDFGQKNQMFIVGHTLVWHNQTPDWFFGKKDGSKRDKKELVSLIKSYIDTVVGRYRGRVHAWDVVNEVIDENGEYRSTTWVNGIGNGDELVELAFKSAQETDPDAELYYNDFNVWRPAKRDGIVRLVRMLQKKGIRIDGVGMQAHWGLNYPKNEYIEAAIDTFASLGIKVMISELDIDILPLTKEGQIIGRCFTEKQFQLEEFEDFLDPYKEGIPDEIEKKLTNRYTELFQIFNSKSDKISRVTFWGVHDGMSWKNTYPIPNRTNYPLLFNRDKSAKPVVRKLIELAN
ncbi:endo-1,4-beta-xylanase [Carboxylicivirga marina]|uniref:Beta-xylanase n=1 Tax=Carboxylicivirga marina TaxID=2800988 RepID=A0ABS1HEL4_9BACT|nr:endo-1,4-beta-xylanase [Carboxylicivirga marina]MBK3516072.1 endo-1,4-beta-xylanase [Carboxylicivirga marina]